MAPIRSATAPAASSEASWSSSTSLPSASGFAIVNMTYAVLREPHRTSQRRNQGLADIVGIFRNAKAITCLVGPLLLEQND